MNTPLINSLLQNLRKEGILRGLKNIPRFNDEPHFFQWSCENASLVEGNDGVATDLINYNARFKAIAESIERYFLITPSKELIKKSYSSIKDNALDPLEVLSISDPKSVNEDFKKQIQSEPFYWNQGIKLSSGEKVLIPSQLVYTSNLSSNLSLSIPISTGAAFGFSEEDTIRRGLEEVVERDSFMRSWLEKKFKKINFPKELTYLEDYFNRYFLEPHLFVADTPFGGKTYFSILVDNTGKGPAVSSGLSYGNNSIKGIRKTLYEAQQVRSWLRFLRLSDELTPIRDINQIVDFKTRGAFWYEKEKIQSLNFMIQKEPERDIKYKPSQLTLKDTLLNQGHEIYAVDLVPENLKKYNFKVIKCIVPSLLPLKISETLPYHPQPLRKLDKKLNSIPHPFL